jgi:hypothetical protein
MVCDLKSRTFSTYEPRRYPSVGPSLSFRFHRAGVDQPKVRDLLLRLTDILILPPARMLV